jgi:hypothetical protein
LRAAIVSLNTHAKRAFILGGHCSFNEGGIASKSRYNPVCQYKSSKPDKHRMDFFILVNASEGKKFIYHLDVYQGKLNPIYTLLKKHGDSRLNKKLW